MTEFPDLLTKLHNLKFDYNEEGSLEKIQVNGLNYGLEISKQMLVPY